MFFFSPHFLFSFLTAVLGVLLSIWIPQVSAECQSTGFLFEFQSIKYNLTMTDICASKWKKNWNNSKAKNVLYLKFRGMLVCKFIMHIDKPEHTETHPFAFKMHIHNPKTQKTHPFCLYTNTIFNIHTKDGEGKWENLWNVLNVNFPLDCYTKLSFFFCIVIFLHSHPPNIVSKIFRTYFGLKSCILCNNSVFPWISIFYLN